MEINNLFPFQRSVPSPAETQRNTALLQARDDEAGDARESESAERSETRRADSRAVDTERVLEPRPRGSLIDIAI